MISCQITEILQDAFELEAKKFTLLMDGFSKAKDGDFAKRAELASNIAIAYGTPGRKYVANAMRGGEVYGLVGLMMLSLNESDSYVKVENICTHPLTSGAGVLLIEHAVEVSKSLGKGGTLRLYDASRSDFYDHLGFKVVDGQTKELVGGIKHKS